MLPSLSIVLNEETWNALKADGIVNENKARKQMSLYEKYD
jgi:hypothetical protein